MHNIFNPYMMT